MSEIDIEIGRYQIVTMFYFDVLQHESDQSIINLFHKLSSSHVLVILASIFLINFVNLI